MCNFYSSDLKWKFTKCALKLSKRVVHCGVCEKGRFKIREMSALVFKLAECGGEFSDLQTMGQFCDSDEVGSEKFSQSETETRIELLCAAAASSKRFNCSSHILSELSLQLVLKFAKFARLLRY